MSKDTKPKPGPTNAKKGIRNSVRMNGKAGKTRKGEPAGRNNGKSKAGYSVAKTPPAVLAGKIAEDMTKPARRKAARAARRQRTAPPHSPKQARHQSVETK